MTKPAFVKHHGQDYYHLDDIRDLPEFFMTLVSSGDHWMFLSSKGGLTAGRVDPEHALFPYVTVDKVCASRGYTGPRTMIRCRGRQGIWEPFADWTPQLWQTRQGLARNRAGSRVIFDEINLDLELKFSYSWAFSRHYGFVREVTLQNLGKQAVQLEVLDGLCNLVSPGVTRHQITEYSCLIDAYKDNVVAPALPLAVFALSALVTDRAEAAEALEASVAWFHGAQPADISLDRTAFSDFAAGRPFEVQHRSRGSVNDFITRQNLTLGVGDSRTWYIVADRDLDSAAVDRLATQLATKDFDLLGALERDIQDGETRLHELVTRADGLSVVANPLQSWHHYSNVLFNIMRGGVPADPRQVAVADVLSFIQSRNILAAKAAQHLLSGNDKLDYHDFRTKLETSGNANLIRLGMEYLPLTFSRRHGDPSRPWNLFAIKVEDKHGNPVLNYQGNWRDIFQNWEALGLSYPDFLPAFTAAFLNATTLDGYNPYRVTREGAEWEKLEPHNPWSNIGYWSDHQIIYLQKLLEWMDAFMPGRLERELSLPHYSYSSVPYRIASYQEICQHPKSTISFDYDLDARIDAACAQEGTDARLVHDASGAVYHGTLAEKILTLFLAKIANLVPGGGIWMNTQRPEWNDANNALVGNGLSVVTLAQLRRFTVFWIQRLAKLPDASFTVAQEVLTFMEQVQKVLAAPINPALIAHDPQLRRTFMDEMGAAAEAYRSAIYREFRFSEKISQVHGDKLVQFFQSALLHIDASLAMLQRDDGLFHSYNIVSLESDSAGTKTAQVKPLTLMLEGQVALLGAHFLSPKAAADLFDAIRKSGLYRHDQHSYMLYPARELPDFLTKNQLDSQVVGRNPLLSALLQEKNTTIVCAGNNYVHFAAGLSNHQVLEAALLKLATIPRWADLVRDHGAAVHQLYESCFRHAEYTGRSGTMYAYEGIGSIYWHMVSKLLLAASENLALATSADGVQQQRLQAAYLDIREGLGYRKPASVYGAFPWEPYSHSPAGAGARQPGMTGQVKEEILTRFSEYGLEVSAGSLIFRPAPLMEPELCLENTQMLANSPKAEAVAVPAGHFACQVCGIPIIRSAIAVKSVELVFETGQIETCGPVLSQELSRRIFSHDGTIRQIRCRS